MWGGNFLTLIISKRTMHCRLQAAYIPESKVLNLWFSEYRLLYRWWWLKIWKAVIVIVEVKTKRQNHFLIFESDHSKLRIWVFTRLGNQRIRPLVVTTTVRPLLIARTEYKLSGKICILSTHIAVRNTNSSSVFDFCTRPRTRIVPISCMRFAYKSSTSGLNEHFPHIAIEKCLVDSPNHPLLRGPFYLSKSGLTKRTLTIL